MESSLPLSDYLRYGRQMILDGIGLPGQLKLQQACVAVVGAGGLGCPALQYLAAAGIGKICVVDHDGVELSNLSRQILHTDARIGVNKAKSAAIAIQAINPSCTVVVHDYALTVENATTILELADVILDCTDNAPTRYLLSDTAVKLGKPLVSGAAQKFEGQLCIYNFGENGPCYRCLFPRPPSPEVTGSCAEVGILGAVTGVIGNLQALETIKIIIGLHEGKPSLLLFSALSLQPFRTIKLRTRSPACPACGKDAAQKNLIEDTDYVTFCGGQRPDWLHLGMQGSENSAKRIRANELREIVESGRRIQIIDVRPSTEFGICRLPGSQNVPLREFVADPKSHIAEGDEMYVVCRLGNDSQIAAEALRSIREDIVVKDLVGGLRAWATDVDKEFPVY